MSPAFRRANTVYLLSQMRAMTPLLPRAVQLRILSPTEFAFIATKTFTILITPAAIRRLFQLSAIFLQPNAAQNVYLASCAVRGSLNFTGDASINLAATRFTVNFRVNVFEKLARQFRLFL